jgi:hypothetical protein
MALLPLLEAVRGADCLVLLTDHAEFAVLKPQVVGPLMRHRLLVDARGCVNPQEWVAEGFQVTLLGDGKTNGPGRAEEQRSRVSRVTGGVEGAQSSPCTTGNDQAGSSEL